MGRTGSAYGYSFTAMRVFLSVVEVALLLQTEDLLPSCSSDGGNRLQIGPFRLRTWDKATFPML